MYDDATFESHPVTHSEPAAFTLDCDGTIHDCNPTAERLFGYRRDELVLRHISLLLPQLAEVHWVEDGQPNPHLRFRGHIGHPFQAVTRNGNHFTSKMFLNDLGNAEQCRVRLVIRCIGEPSAPAPVVSERRPQ